MVRSGAFHGKPDGETTSGRPGHWPGGAAENTEPLNGAGDTVASQLEIGILVGVLVGEGHFGGDGRQPHVTLRMHTDHETLFEWIVDRFPGGKLYGPYHHGGRSYYQWMARGEFLRDELVPLLDEHLPADLDEKTFGRYVDMKRRYGLGERPADGGPSAAKEST